MSSLILVKHSLPEIVPDVPAHRWRLSQAGRDRCLALARRLAGYGPDAIVTSTEPKAAETAEIVAAQLGRPLQPVEGLQEHDRSKIGFLSAEAFEEAIASLFARPHELVFGGETARQAGERFGMAVGGVLQDHPDRTVAIVTHGTVMTLFLAEHAGVDPFPYWRRLGLPSFAVLSLPSLRLRETVASVDEAPEPAGGSGRA